MKNDQVLLFYSLSKAIMYSCSYTFIFTVTINFSDCDGEETFANNMTALRPCDDAT